MRYPLNGSSDVELTPSVTRMLMAELRYLQISQRSGGGGMGGGSMELHGGQDSVC